MGPTPRVTRVATFSSEHLTVRSHKSKISVSKKHQGVLNVRVYVYLLEGFESDSPYEDILPKVWSRFFAATHHSAHVAIFHYWLSFQVCYDSRTCVALLTEVGRFCPMLDSFVR